MRRLSLAILLATATLISPALAVQVTLLKNYSVSAADKDPVYGVHSGGHILWFAAGPVNQYGYTEDLKFSVYDDGSATLKGTVYQDV